MPYAARADLAARFGADELDDLAPVDQAGASGADEALADATAEIDSVLARAYDLPLGAGPWPALVDAACAIARLGLFDDGAPKRVRREAEAARGAVAAIALGERELVDAAGAVAPRRTRASFDGENPFFRRSSLRDL